MTTEERFWRNVKRTDGCWLWQGARYRDGYGAFKSGVMVRAHRYAYEQRVGPISVGQVVMHLCDNPLCVRPDHLRAATQLDNMADCKAKGRVATAANGRNRRTVERPAAKLTEQQVQDIRKQWAASGGKRGAMTSIAQSFGVTTPTVHRIVRGHAWRLKETA